MTELQNPTEFQPRVAPGTRVWAVGDIHGRDDLLAELLAVIARDGRRAPETRKLVVFLGDYIDRGPDSPGVIERLMAGPPPGFEWICLRGNHEQQMLAFLDDPAAEAAWLRNGGLATLAAYGGYAGMGGMASRFKEALSEPDGLSLLRDLLERVLPSWHRDFMAGRPLSHREGDYLFVHAGIRPGRAIDRQELEDLLWIRRPFLDSTVDFGVMVVHGHTIVQRPEVHRRRIAIDTGAWRSGRLTALVLAGHERGFLGTSP